MSKKPPDTTVPVSDQSDNKAISGHLLNIGSSSKLADTDSERIVGYYVIIGRGPAAWYNHLTLLGTRVNNWKGEKGNAWGVKRLNDLPVMQIGLKESWSRRKHERMGQWPRMLNLFAEVDDSLTLDTAFLTDKDKATDWLPAKVFSDLLEQAETYIKAWYETNTKPFILKDGFAGVIEQEAEFKGTKGAPNADYKLPQFEAERRKNAILNRAQPGLTKDLVVTPENEAEYKSRWLAPDIPFRISVYTRQPTEKKATLQFVYAYKIDVCSSYGTPRTFERNMFEDEALYKAHLPTRDVLARDEPERCPTIIDGNEFIGMDNDSSKTVIVFKGNPVGAQSVQSALDMPNLRSTFKLVYYVSNADIVDNDAGVPGGRNLLEMVGDADEKELERFKPGATPAPKFVKTLQDDLPENHGFEWVDRGHRLVQLDDRLIRASFYEIEKIKQSGTGRVACTFTLKGRTGTVTETIITGADRDYSHASAFTRDNKDVKFESIQYYWLWERLSIALKDGPGDSEPQRLGPSFRHGTPEKDKHFVYESAWVLEGEKPATAKLPPAPPGQPYPSPYDTGVKIEAPKQTLEVKIVVRQLKEITADRLVYALGQQNDNRIEGCAAYLTQKLVGLAPHTNDALAGNFYNCVSGGGPDDDVSSVNGTASVSGRVRILGAAAAVGPGCPADIGYTVRHQLHGTTLCKEMPAGGGGLNVNLPCIRRANQFVGLRVKINSASEKELVAAKLSSEAAKWIIATRAKTDRGYTLEQYRDMMNGIKVDIKKVGVRYPNSKKAEEGEKSDTLSGEAGKLTELKFEF
jgi:hypothetical protein